MGILIFLMVQTLEGAPFPEAPLPRIYESEIRAMELQHDRDIEERVGGEVFALYTRFDSSLRIRDAWGGGADLKLGLDVGTRAMLEFRLGFAGWNTTDDPSQAPQGMAKVRQYRLGVGGDFLVKHLEFGIYGNFGVYRFERNGGGDTPGFFEIMGQMGWRPIPEVKFGLMAALTMSNSDFNRGSTHFIANGSIGPSIEVKF